MVKHVIMNNIKLRLIININKIKVCRQPSSILHFAIFT